MRSHLERYSFPVIALLQIFREKAGLGSALTIEEIREELVIRLRPPYYKYYYYVTRDSGEWINSTLQDLGELGLVVADETREESSGFKRWRIGGGWRPPEPPSGGGGDGNRDTPAVGDGDDDNGGGGLRETLEHPVLFALDREDFDGLVDGLFNEDQP